jgi:hypothetical protein
MPSAIMEEELSTMLLFSYKIIFLCCIAPSDSKQNESNQYKNPPKLYWRADLIYLFPLGYSNSKKVGPEFNYR